MTPRRGLALRPDALELDRRLLLSLTPAEVRLGYGLGTSPVFNIGGRSYAADGTGQTIAIIDFQNDPTIYNDSNVFDQEFSAGAGAPSLYNAYGPSQSWLTVTGVPGEGPVPNANASTTIETSLDVELAHAIAPGAKILLIETSSTAWQSVYGAPGYSIGAVNYARSFPNVSVVSMSFGLAEVSGLSLAAEQSVDPEFTSPVGHTPIAFLAGSGDSGANPATVNGNGQRGGPAYPATSPNVVAVGGTNVNTDAYGNFLSETGWSGSGGGYSFEPEPSYQYATQLSGRRTVPDVAYDAGTNVAIYDSFGGVGGNTSVGGTSAGAPQWAALVAIADEGRNYLHKTTLDGPNQLLPTLYSSATTADFHDIKSGFNGYYATNGYDLVTGRGTPIDTRVITDLMNLPGNWTSNGSSIMMVPAIRLPNGLINLLDSQGNEQATPLPDASVEKSSTTTHEASKPVGSVDRTSTVPLLIPQVVDSALEGWQDESTDSIVGRSKSRHFD